MALRSFSSKSVALLRPTVIGPGPRGHSLSSVTMMHPIEASVSKLPPSKPHFTMYNKYTAGWWKDVLVVGTVFSVTGSCSLQFVQPTINSLGLQGSMRDGPWLYRTAHLTLSPPAWCAMLVTIGTLAGKRPYFTAVASKVMGRFIALGKLPGKYLGIQPKSKLIKA